VRAGGLGSFGDAEEVGDHLPRLLAQWQPLVEKLAVSIRLVQLGRVIPERRRNRATQDALQVTRGTRYPLRQPVENQLNSSAVIPGSRSLFKTRPASYNDEISGVVTTNSSLTSSVRLRETPLRRPRSTTM